MKEIKFVDPEEAKMPSENPVCKIIIKYLKDGLSQKQIAFNLQANEIKPNRGAARIPALNSHLYYNVLHNSQLCLWKLNQFYNF